MKKPISFMLVIIMVFSIIQSGISISATQSGDYTYVVYESEATITGYSGNDETVVIPDTLGGYPVTAIGSSAFYRLSNLKNITIPEGVRSIGNYAFNFCTALSDITIPDSVTSIGDYAFGHYCTSLKSVKIGSGLNSIGLNAFYGCTSLTEFTVDNKNTSYSSKDGVLFNKDASTLLQYPSGKAGSYTIPNSVKSVSKNAFYYSVGLTELNIPSSVTNIGDTAIGNCPALTKINVDGNNTYYASSEGVLFTKDKTVLVQYPNGKSGSYTIPEGVTQIKDSAFSYSTKLTNITIPDGVTDIGKEAFSNCSSLVGATLPDTVTHLGDGAFANCDNLKYGETSRNLRILGSYAFYNCPNLICVTIPNKDTIVGDGVFELSPNVTVFGIEGSHAQKKTAVVNQKFEYFVEFLDATPSKWYYNAVAYCVNNKIMTGTGTKIFSPDTIMTRAMFVTVLSKLEGSKIPEYTTSSFTDVSMDSWYFKYVEWAYQKGLVKGIGEGIFGPENPVTREQLALFLFQATERRGYGTSERNDLSRFTDKEEVGDWALEAVQWAVEAGMISGTSTTTLSPTASATRAQVAQMVANFSRNYE